MMCYYVVVVWCFCLRSFDWGEIVVWMEELCVEFYV